MSLPCRSVAGKNLRLRFRRGEEGFPARPRRAAFLARFNGVRFLSARTGWALPVRSPPGASSVSSLRKPVIQAFTARRDKKIGAPQRIPVPSVSGDQDTLCRDLLSTGAHIWSGLNLKNPVCQANHAGSSPYSRLQGLRGRGEQPSAICSGKVTEGASRITLFLCQKALAGTRGCGA